MKKTLRNNGLSIVLFSAFLIFQLGLSLVGLAHYNNEQTQHGKAVVDYLTYIQSSNFMETTMENWESEFLQMFAYVVLTAYLYQKGSAESKDPDDDKEPVNTDPRRVPLSEDLPWPVKRGGIALRIYENSLGLAFLALFLISFSFHAVSGSYAYNESQLEHGGQTVSVAGYLATSQFWFESLQNWQSEFFSIGLMVVLTIYLRQRGSPESKPVACLHYKHH